MYSSIGVDEFYQKTKEEKVVILDIRETDEFENGHIPEVATFPLSELEEKLDELEKSQEYYIICQTGGRSAMACEFLGNQGYQVVNVMGGMSAWKGEVM